MVSRIVPRVYLTDYENATNARNLSYLAATHVVSIIDEDVRVPRSIKKENKLHIWTENSSEADIFQHLDKTTAFIQAALEENVVVVGQPS